MGLVATLALLLAGCRLDVVADVAVGADGSGTVGVTFHLDAALLDALDALGVDPTAELQAAALATEEWELERTSDGDQLTLQLERDIAQATGFGDALRELTSGLSSDDPALLLDLDVRVDGSGASEVTGNVGFRPPATAGVSVDGEPLGPTPDELRELVERAVAPALIVTLPGAVGDHDADDVDGRTLRWAVPIGDERSIAARAEPAPWWETYALWLAIGAGVLVLATVLLVWLLRRGGRRGARRRRRRRQRR